MTLCRATNVLGDERFSLRSNALEQTFHAKDPRENPRDDGVRDGFRSAGVCYGWDGFDQFWDMAGSAITQLGHLIYPEAVWNSTRSQPPTDIQLTLSRDGDFFGRHTDAGYCKDEEGNHVAVVAFVYYLGDQSSFTGGELQFDDFAIPPTDDSLVVFLGSAEHHAVSTVVGGDAMRLTIKGYFANV